MTQRPDDDRDAHGDPTRPDDLFAPPEPPAPTAMAPTAPDPTDPAPTAPDPTAREGLAPLVPTAPLLPGSPFADPRVADPRVADPRVGGPPRDLASAPRPEAAHRQPRRRRTGAGIVALALLAGVVGGFAGGRLSDAADGDRLADAALPTGGSGVAHEADGSTDRDAADGAGSAAGPAGSVAALAADVLPSVVSIEATGDEGTATGSGFVLRADGYLLTNNHVVEGAVDGAGADGNLVVTFSDGRERPAELVGRTADYDLAVLKVDVKGLEPLVLGDSDQIAVGDPVLAVGAPLGLDATVTTGIVSALHRPVQAGDDAQAAFIDAIQTDAAINPGNSGGPLVDAAGEVVGINSAIAQPPGAVSATGSIGLGFAIPAKQARHTAEQLIETGHATYPVIGVLLDTAYRGEGVQVSGGPQDGQPAVTPEGPADEAGIRAGDVILSVDGRPVSRSDELIVAIRARQPGDAVTLRVRADGDEHDVRVVLQAQDSR